MRHHHLLSQGSSFCFSSSSRNCFRAYFSSTAKVFDDKKKTCHSQATTTTTTTLSFKEQLLSGMAEEAERRLSDRFTLPVDQFGLMKAIALGGGSLATSNNSLGEEELLKVQRRKATDHIVLCLKTLPSKYFDGSEVISISDLQRADHRYFAQEVVTGSSRERRRRKDGTVCSGWSLLHHAAFVGNYDACRLLLRHQELPCTHGENLSHSLMRLVSYEKTELTPLELAVVAGHCLIVNHLLGRCSYSDRSVSRLSFSGCSGERILWYWQLQPRTTEEGESLMVALSSHSRASSILSRYPPQQWGITVSRIILKGFFFRNKRFPLKIMKFLRQVEGASLLPQGAVLECLYETFLGTCYSAPSHSSGTSINYLEAILRKVDELMTSRQRFISGLTCYTRLTSPIEVVLAAAKDSDRSEVVFQKSVQIIQFLIEQGFDVNQLTPSGKTSLFVAVGRGLVRLSTFLLSVGADPDQKTHTGCRPIDWTWTPSSVRISRNNRKLRSLLRAHHAAPEIKRFPQTESAHQTQRTRSLVDSAGMFRKNTFLNSERVMSTIVANFCLGLTLELGEITTPKIFTSEEDHRLYLSAFESMKAFHGSLTDTRFKNKTCSAEKFYGFWNTLERKKDSFLAPLEGGEGTFTIKVVPLPQTDSRFVAKASLMWRSNWDPHATAEQHPVPLHFPHGFSPDHGNCSEISDDGFTLFFQKSLVQVMKAAMQRHEMEMKKQVLDEASKDREAMRLVQADWRFDT